MHEIMIPHEEDDYSRRVILGPTLSRYDGLMSLCYLYPIVQNFDYGTRSKLAVL